MLTTIENLQIGDEILTSAGSNIRYLKILRLPQLSKTKVKWNTKAPLYKAVKYSTRKEIKITSWTRHDGTIINRETNEYVCTDKDHNFELFQNLNDRVIWLIKTKFI